MTDLQTFLKHNVIDVFYLRTKRLQGLIKTFRNHPRVFIYLKLISVANITICFLKLLNQTVCFGHNNLDLSVTKACVYKAR